VEGNHTQSSVRARAVGLLLERPKTVYHLGNVAHEDFCETDCCLLSEYLSSCAYSTVVVHGPGSGYFQLSFGDAPGDVPESQHKSLSAVIL
jgi:hypothetical protein